MSLVDTCICGAPVSMLPADHVCPRRTDGPGWIAWMDESLAAPEIQLITFRRHGDDMLMNRYTRDVLAERERERIVAWLRDAQHATWPPRSRFDIADAIERGEHLK